MDSPAFFEAIKRYDSIGHMAAQLMRPDRPMAIDCGTSTAAPSENSQSVNGYDAYFGTYTIDETSHTVTHHLEGPLAAADVGKNLVREFQLSGDKLTITVRTNSPKEKQIRTLLQALNDSSPISTGSFATSRIAVPSSLPS